MASYSASMIVMGITGKPMRGGGSFANINIDGRLSLDAAITWHGKHLKKNAISINKIISVSLLKKPRALLIIKARKWLILH